MRGTLLKKLIALVALMLMLGGASAATAAKDDNQGKAGPNGSNEHGLCTAYFNGQKEGHDKNGQPGPFAALEETSRAYAESDGVDNDGDGDVDEEGEGQDMSAAEAIYNFCSDTTTIGGNPDHGRFTCIADSDPDTAGDQTSCEDNEKPGASDDK